jgi:L-Ala-D/L-Glu epimerase
VPLRGIGIGHVRNEGGKKVRVRELFFLIPLPPSFLNCSGFFQGPILWLARSFSQAFDVSSFQSPVNAQRRWLILTTMSDQIKIQFKPYRLEFRFPFRIAHGMRTGTDAVYIELSLGQHKGYGEATLPPYLPDNLETVFHFFNQIKLQKFPTYFNPSEEFYRIDSEIAGCLPGKAALDMALWQLKANMEARSVSDLLNINKIDPIPHTYTIGVGSESETADKVAFALKNGFSFFKLKLNGEDDEKVIGDFLKASSLPFAVDVNQAWKKAEDNRHIIDLLESSGCVLIEQPFNKSDLHETALLKKITSLPVIADEACQRLNDIAPISEAFDGINIKLQKCGGISEAWKMIHEARRRNLKVLMGCMSESSIGCNAAEVLAPLCNWADLDGPWLISNDPSMNRIF